MKRWLLVVGVAIAHLVVMDVVNNNVANAAPILQSSSHVATGARLVTGDNHSCVLLHTGVVRCWGDNAFGQLGVATPSRSSSPVTVSSFGDNRYAVGLAAGIRHTCALLNDGSLSCWGDNSFGSLGNGTFLLSKTPVPVSTPAGPFQLVAAGGYTTCGIDVDRMLWCWGANSFGQVGSDTNGDSVTSPSAVNPPNGSTLFVSVDVGGNHVCGVSHVRATWCWGDNGVGQLGDNTDIASAAPVPTVSFGSYVGAAGMSTGDNHSCAVLTTTAVRCWGSNGNVQLGVSDIEQSLSPISVSGSLSAVAIAAGTSHTCVIRPDASVSCWGANGGGRLGNKSLVETATPVVAQLPNGVLAQEIAAGSAHTCALLDTEDVVCWGSNGNGQVGDGTLTSRNVPTYVVNLRSAASASTDEASDIAHDSALVTTSFVSVDRSSQRTLVYGTDEFLEQGNTTVDLGHFGPVQHVSAGAHHSCVVLSGGHVKCWGSNDSGALGDGTIMPQELPVDVQGLSGTARVVAVGGGHSCAVLTNGALQCWGNNASGQIGDNSVISRSQPVTVMSSGIADVALGDSFTCAITFAGALWCWGANDAGQLGRSGSGSLVPVEVIRDDSFAAVSLSAGTNSACMVLHNATVKCWGNSVTTPTSPGTFSAGVSTVSVGGSHACATLHTGAVQCWGSDNNGQLGNGDTDSSNLLVTAVFADNDHARHIASSGDSTCATLATGSVKCWGANIYGVIAQGNTVHIHEPTLVEGLAEIQQVSLGEIHGCALSLRGDVQCWGSDDRQQRGVMGDDVIAPELLAVFADATVVTELLALEEDTSYFYRVDTTVLGTVLIGEISTFNTLQRPEAPLVEEPINEPDTSEPLTPSPDSGERGDSNIPGAAPNVREASPDVAQSNNAPAASTQITKKPARTFVKAGSWTKTARVLKLLNYRLPQRGSKIRVWMTVLDKRVCRIYNGQLWAIRRGTCRLMVLKMSPSRRLTMSPHNLKVIK